jgi:hypothetical protein
MGQRGAGKSDLGCGAITDRPDGLYHSVDPGQSAGVRVNVGWNDPGRCPLCRILGNRLCTWFQWKLNPDWEAAAGMILLAFFVELFCLVPVIGTLLVMFMLDSAFGAVLLTRFGLRRFEVDFTN